MWGTNIECTPFKYDVSGLIEEPRMEVQEDCRRIPLTSVDFCLTEGQTGSWFKRDWEYCGECVDEEKQTEAASL